MPYPRHGRARNKANVHEKTPQTSWPPLRETPTVSVIIPAYNCGAYLAETLDSVLAQDYPRLEILVIDDGSKDDTVAVAESYGPPVRVLHQQGSGNGAGPSRNTGLRTASGEVIAFLDGDDVWLPGKLNAQLACLREHPESAMVATDFTLWYPQEDNHWRASGQFAEEYHHTDPHQLDPTYSGWLYHRLLLETCVWTGTVVMRRELVDEIGLFREDLRLGQDYDYWIRASRHTPILTLQRPFALYRRHGESATKRWAPVNYELKVFEDALHTWGREGPDGESISPAQIRRRRFGLHFSMGYKQYWNGQKRDSLHSFVNALRLRPMHWRTAAYVFVTIAQSAYACARHAR